MPTDELESFLHDPYMHVWGMREGQTPLEWLSLEDYTRDWAEEEGIDV